jgi:hypothetical protein
MVASIDTSRVSFLGDSWEIPESMPRWHAG